eukprot:911210-Pyramimonas_sp.AAC.1
MPYDGKAANRGTLTVWRRCGADVEMTFGTSRASEEGAHSPHRPNGLTTDSQTDRCGADVDELYHLRFEEKKAAEVKRAAEESGETLTAQDAKESKLLLVEVK